MIERTWVSPEATVRYMWLNRVTNKVEPKVSDVRKVGHYVLGVGYSAPRATADDARAMLERAVALARAEGHAAAARFNDRRGDFVKDDLYVFMVNMDSGRFEAMGMNPALSDTDALGLHDAAGHALVAEMIAKLQSADEATVDYVWRNPVTNRVENKHSLRAPRRSLTDRCRALPGIREQDLFPNATNPLRFGTLHAQGTRWRTPFASKSGPRPSAASRPARPPAHRQRAGFGLHRHAERPAG